MATLSVKPASAKETYILTLSCLDHPGIVGAVGTFLSRKGCNILDAQQSDDIETSRFFMRVEFCFVSHDRIKPLRESFIELAIDHGMDYQIRAEKDVKKVLILVSKFDHCLADLLYRWRIGEMAMDIVGIVSNHPADVHPHLNFSDIPFYHLPVNRENKADQEAEIFQLVENTGADLVILARYMQILSNELSTKLAGRCINIHHSFLPGFKGARPYHQAHARGVKLIGATAHFVTSDLDEGPIIEQDVERISHRDSPESLVLKGRNIERRVLTQAVNYYLSDRVFLNGKKTVIFT